jgi:hypothetical protein
MRKGVHYIFISLLVAGLMTACSKSGNSTDDGGGGGGPHIVTDNDTTRPVLTVTTPLNNQLYANGSSISVSGTITDDMGLYRGSIRITNDVTGEILKEQLYEIHGIRSYNFNVPAIATVTAVTDYTVSVFFEDHGLNSISQTLKVKMNP